MNNNNHDKCFVFGIALDICFLINNFDADSEKKNYPSPQINLVKIK